MKYRISTSNERVWYTTQLAKLSFNHSIGRTHSWRFSTFFIRAKRVSNWYIPKKKSARVHACTCARVHACSTSLGLSVSYYVPHTYVSHISSAPKIRTPYTQNNISYFGGMYRKNKGVPGLELATYRHAHQKQACTLLYTCVAWFFFPFLMGCCPLHNIKPTLRTSTDFYCLLVLLVRQKHARIKKYNTKKLEINIKQETRPRGAGFRTRELFLDCLTVLNPCATPAWTWQHHSRYLSVHHRTPTPLLDAVASGARRSINARSCSPPTTTWILGAYPPSSKASARRRRCSSRDAARSCDQINCKKRVLPALFHKRCPSQPTFSPWVHTSDDSYIYQLSLVLATATVSFITSDWATTDIRLCYWFHHFSCRTPTGVYF